ncbi:DNA polymerase III subunit delta [Pseudodesulfovibrio sp. JC047]|uniref:DNA polymerase III subunit delta n=1 Tax=Pseudodesulfovibrio sp. JC047 TaxID=2683199 RepID=UPI0013D03B98|nr:DNA polymerase III subunit delta [Pseudodesulfovibrio sp. JC047]NDV20393.1 DNA polymerase III subunit delta [Pseudodesulfovibrio sp. JC047]
MTRPKYLFLICPDPQLIKAQIEERLQASGQTNWETKTFWGDDEDPLPNTFWTDLTIKSLFPQPKVLVVRRAHTLKAEHWDKLDASVKGLGTDIFPVFCLEGLWKGKKPPVPVALSRRGLFKKAKKEQWLWESKGLDQRSLTNFVKAWAAREGLTFEPGAGQALAFALPMDAVAARLELDKIELATGDERVVRKEYVDLVAQTGEMPFFDFMDALSQPGAEVAIWKRVLDDHSKSAKDQMLFNLIGFLASQARMYWMLANGENPKGNPYMLKKKAPVARQLGNRGVARMIDLALEAELSLKTGERKYEEALDILMAGLIDVFQPKRPARRNR